MNLKADVDRKFILRFLIIAIGCFGLMIWGLYDAVYAYPEELVRAKFYKELEVQNEGGELDNVGMKEKWESTCLEKGWSIVKPKSPDVAQQDIYFQWFLFGVGLVGGVFFLVKYMRLLGSYMEADEDGVKTSWGQELRFENIQEINKRKWAKKGIAKVSYQDESGAAKTMIFDDFKYHRETMGKILRLAEKNLSDDKIVDGEREKDEKNNDEIAVIEDDAS